MDKICPECKGRCEIHTAEGEHYAEIAVHGRHQFEDVLWEDCPICKGTGRIPVYETPEQYNTTQVHHQITDRRIK